MQGEAGRPNPSEFPQEKKMQLFYRKPTFNRPQCVFFFQQLPRAFFSFTIHCSQIVLIFIVPRNNQFDFLQSTQHFFLTEKEALGQFADSTGSLWSRPDQRYPQSWYTHTVTHASTQTNVSLSYSQVILGFFDSIDLNSRPEAAIVGSIKHKFQAENLGFAWCPPIPLTQNCIDLTAATRATSISRRLGEEAVESVLFVKVPSPNLSPRLIAYRE